MSQEIKRLDQFRLQCRQFEVLGSGVLCSVLCSGFTVLAARGRERRTANLEPNPEPSTQNPEPRTPPHRNEKRISRAVAGAAYVIACRCSNWRAMMRCCSS